jgi:hypothetical protein
MLFSRETKTIKKIGDVEIDDQLLNRVSEKVVIKKQGSLFVSLF